jgi:integrase
VHIENYLIPVIGDVPLSRLTPQDVAAVFASLTDGSTAPARPLRPASVRRVYATLRSALNVAVKQQHLDRNPALLIHLDSGARPKALVWTAERVALWKETGKRPSPVMVWTPEQTGAFLDSASDDPLYALYHLVALRGLRRGEAVGLSWSDVDLDSGVILIREQVVQLGWRTQRTTPKAGSERMIALDTGTTQVLREHRARQDGQLRDLGLPPRSVPYVFTRADGELVHPNFVTRHFADLIAAAQLPPIRLHDLRHGAATLALAAGTDMKVVQEMLGHSSITITADTYTSVLPEIARAAAQAAADLIPRERRPRV